MEVPKGTRDSLSWLTRCYLKFLEEISENPLTNGTKGGIMEVPKRHTVLSVTGGKVGTIMAKLTSEQKNGIWKRYLMSNDSRLSDVYGRYSYAKERAWDYCERLREKYNGFGLRILSHNTFVFTCAFEFEDKETGEAHLMYITPSQDTII